MAFLRFLVSSLLAAACCAALADDRADCAAGSGSFLTGVVTAMPKFAPGHLLKGVELSHTHIRLRGDADGKPYDIAADDVFASGYQLHREQVPTPLDAIAVGQRLELCGLPYKGGMHWVHTNCGDTPTARDPAGWLKTIAADGSVGPSLEDSQKYCYLWPRNGTSAHRTYPPGTSGAVVPRG